MLRSAEAHYAEQAALAALVSRRSQQLWARVPVSDVNAWARTLPQMASIVAAAQYRAAATAEPYVASALAEQEVDVTPEAKVAAQGFMGRASDGRPLVTLLDEPRITALTQIRDGAPPESALERAGRQLQMLAITQVQDAGRLADSVAIFARPKVGWVRMVNPPCCDKCAILAGKWFRSNQGFLRHPRCDCRHIPAVENTAGDVGTDPKALFDSGQVKGLTAGQQQAIADGADLNRVVNVRRNAMTTTENATRGVRLTPDRIYRTASNRDEALSLLKRHGYVV